MHSMCCQLLPVNRGVCGVSIQLCLGVDSSVIIRVGVQVMPAWVLLGEWILQGMQCGQGNIVFVLGFMSHRLLHIESTAFHSKP